MTLIREDLMTAAHLTGHAVGVARAASVRRHACCGQEVRKGLRAGCSPAVGHAEGHVEALDARG